MSEHTLFLRYPYTFPITSSISFQLSYIRATAEVQNPEICILSSNVVLEEVYVDVPVVKEIVLENKTLLSSNISWKQVSSLPKRNLTIMHANNRNCIL
jgi:hypothetical protein